MPMFKKNDASKHFFYFRQNFIDGCPLTHQRTTASLEFTGILRIYQKIQRLLSWWVAYACHAREMRYKSLLMLMFKAVSLLNPFQTVDEIEANWQLTLQKKLWCIRQNNSTKQIQTLSQIGIFPLSNFSMVWLKIVQLWQELYRKVNVVPHAFKSTTMESPMGHQWSIKSINQNWVASSFERADFCHTLRHSLKQNKKLEYIHSWTSINLLIHFLAHLDWLILWVTGDPLSFPGFSNLIEMILILWNFVEYWDCFCRNIRNEPF